MMEGVDSSPREVDADGSVSEFSMPAIYEADDGIRPSTMQLGSRTSSLPRLGAKGGLRGIHRGSKSSGSLARVGTAPTGLRSSTSRRMPIISGDSASAERKNSASADRLPAVEGISEKYSTRWGADSCKRHKLLVAAQGIAEKEAVGTFSYKCHLCERVHEMSPKQKLEEICQ